MNWNFIYRGETRDLDESARASTSGSFVRLSKGFTHYELGGPESGQPVVLVHGFSVPYFIWDPTFAALTSSGFRVLRFDLYGRGFSDRPRLEYNLDLFVHQLRNLLDMLKLRQINLIGLSMGGPITASFTAQLPERVRRLVLVDPSGARPIALSPILKAALVPGIGELALGLFGGESLVKGMASDFFDPEHVARFQDKYRVQMMYRGFKRAILSSMRNGMLGSFQEAYQRVGGQGMPVLIFWGRNDATVPFDHSRQILEAIPRAELHVVENCGHIPHYERPDLVNSILIEFLKR